jgi:hypothetical protein
LSINWTTTHFLTQEECNRLICHFGSRAIDLLGQRRLVVILPLRALGLRDLRLVCRIKQRSVKKQLLKDLNSAGEKEDEFIF